jgi:protein-tyrosine-phosphatase
LQPQKAAYPDEEERTTTPGSVIRRAPGETRRPWGLRVAARLVRGVRRFPQRLLHPARRRAALAALAARPRPASVLVLCNGNIFRSPFAAAVLRRALGGESGGVAVDSAGFQGPGRESPKEAVEAAARRGIDLSGHRSQLVTPALVRTADLIVVMEAEQRRAVCERFGRSPRDVFLLGDLDPEPITSRSIEDPWGRRATVCAASFGRIDRCIRTLMGALQVPSAR